LLIHGNVRLQAQFRIATRVSDRKLRGLIRRIGLPADALLSIENRKPGKTLVRANGVVNKSILAIAPRTEHHAVCGIGIDDGMCPTWRNDHFVARVCGYGKTTAGIVAGAFLSVDNGASFPD